MLGIVILLHLILFFLSNVRVVCHFEIFLFGITFSKKSGALFQKSSKTAEIFPIQIVLIIEGEIFQELKEKNKKLFQQKLPNLFKLFILHLF